MVLRMKSKPEKPAHSLPAMKVHQWIPKWDEVIFDPKIFQAQPGKKHFYLFSIRASHLKALTGVYRRSAASGPRALDPNVQRGHEEPRSDMIREFVQFGFPWCEMSEAKRSASGADDLRKPGWLPTAIIVNILPPKSKRNGIEIPEDDLVSVEDNGASAVLKLPKGFSGFGWQPEKVFPLEVIDGQHRLWAFDGINLHDEFELPVVAFYGLDRGWQAYLFWSINITPKKINRSLAFDLYPLLRQQTWLDKFAGHSIYRETRCQELVEALWSHPESPWHGRINMLGEAKKVREYKGPMVTQAAWVRSLFHTLVKHWEGQDRKLGGLFGAPRSFDEPVLPWNRPMQAAVLIHAGDSVRRNVAETTAPWAKYLRKFEHPDLFDDDDPAFYGEYSLLSTDQGVRGLLFILNDLLVINSRELELSEWRWDDVVKAVPSKSDKKKVGTSPTATEEETVSLALKSFSKTQAAAFIDHIAHDLAEYDWRTSATPDLPDDVRLRQAVFRGSSGYKEMRLGLLQHLARRKGPVSRVARDTLEALAD